MHLDQAGDSVVQAGDLAVFCRLWLAGAPNLAADIDSPGGDGAVTLRDFAAFARYWRSTPSIAVDQVDASIP